jgi:hypothetical protein
MLDHVTAGEDILGQVRTGYVRLGTVSSCYDILVQVS